MSSPSDYLLAFGSLIMAGMAVGPIRAESNWLALDGQDGPGRGRHVVLIGGDEEYRSEETLSQLGKILAKRHGFRCTVLFAIDPKSGAIDPTIADNIPGLEALDRADLMVLFTRFRNLPDGQMKHIADYVESGRPIVALRTATHAFNIPNDRKYARYSWDNENENDWKGGFGRRVLGETWIAHHGHHGRESTKGFLSRGEKDHPILRGISDGDIWGPSDVYRVRLPLPGDSKPLVLGQVLEGMNRNDKPVAGEKNEPMMPIAWTKSFETGNGKSAKVFTTTMGASQDFASEGLRRLLVNACYWAVGLENKIPAKSDVGLVGEFLPSPFKFDGHVRDRKPSDYAK